MDLISKTLHYIGKNYKDSFVIQIGAMDGISFDDTRGFLDRYRWKSLLVEPIPSLFDVLKRNFKDRDNYLFEQSAITDVDGEVEMLTIPSEHIEKENLHPGYKGMSALYPLKNGFGSEYQRDIDVKNSFGINIKVPGLTFESLLKKHNIQEFDILICDAEGHDWNIFNQIDLNKYKPKFIRLEYINLTNEEKKLTEEKLKNHGYVVSINQNIDGVLKEIWDSIEPKSINNSTDFVFNDLKKNLSKLTVEEKQELLKNLLNPQMDIHNNDLTVVTGLWNINRPGRDFNHYIEHFKKFLEIPVKMFIYIPEEYEHLVWEKRSKENTQVKTYSLQNIKNIYAPFWDKTQAIRNDPAWYNQTGEHGWLKGSPQASLEWYNPIVQSKMFLLNDVTIWNPFNTEYFIWLDAGITNTVHDKYFSEHRVLDNINPLLDSFLFLSYPYETTSEIHGFNKQAMDRIAGENVKYVCRGGLFGGRKEVIREANATYYSLLNNSLHSGFMGTEESIFSLMSYINPGLYRRYELDGNGLIVKFIQNLHEGNVNLVPVQRIHNKNRLVTPNLSGIKTSLYMLTFNFPEQVEYTIKTWEANSSDWLNKPHRKILIDNSNNLDALQGNKEICERYGFEHIITGENLGINRGRQFAAEHFHDSDSDFYFFFEDDMGFNDSLNTGYCRNGFRKYVPDLYNKVHKIMLRENFDFMKLSYTEVYMDNNIQVSWYNVPQHIRTRDWPDYDKLPVSGLDVNAPRTQFKTIEVFEELSYISGDIYYANWPMIVSKEGNKKMFIDIKWEHPFEQTWMSQMYQDTKKGIINPAVLLASPVWHNRIAYYKPEERREN